MLRTVDRNGVTAERMKRRRRKANELGKPRFADELTKAGFPVEVDLRSMQSDPDLGRVCGGELLKLVESLCASMRNDESLGYLGTLWGSELGEKVHRQLLIMSSDDRYPALQRYTVVALQYLTQEGARLQVSRMALLMTALDLMMVFRRSKVSAERQAARARSGMLDRVLRVLREESEGKTTEELEHEVRLCRESSGDPGDSGLRSSVDGG